MESIGFKSQRNSAPMAHLKSKPKTNFSFSNGFPDISSANESGSSFYDNNDSFVDDLDGIFQSNRNNYSSSKKSQNFFDAGDDIFHGGSFSNSKPQKGKIDFDLVFDLKNSNFKSSSNFHGDDLLTSGPREGDALDDFFGNLKKGGTEKGSQYDDLIPGFEGTSLSRSNDSGNTRMASESKISQPSSSNSSKSSSSMTDDPNLFFESSRSEANPPSWTFTDSLEQGEGKSSVESYFDELENFASGKVPAFARNINKQDKKGKNRVEKVTKEREEAVINDIFNMDTHANVEKPRSQAKDPVLDALFNEKREPEVKLTSKQGSSKTSNLFDGFFFSFEETPSFEEFQEIEGESEARRRARLDAHNRKWEQVEKALAEKRQRDLQTQYEQEERHRLGDSLDKEIKHWSSGKEGNLRSLLSSLQEVLGPESGWQPVSWNDLLTPASVKKVYYKANLHVHPDKVQQRGANLQQKYIAEKVFDLLKEAYNKFSAAEL